MKNSSRTSVRFVCRAAFAAGLALAATPSVSTGALAAGPVAGTGQISAITVSATVKSVDTATHHVTLVGPEGNAFTVKVGSAVRNLDRVRPGDQVRATYYRSVLFVLSSPNASVPPDALTAAAARAPKGQLPAGAALNRVTVTGLVVGIDRETHTLQLIDPTGGEIHTVSVLDPQRQKQMNQIKVGDKLTAYITEALLVSVDPA
jgi:hypothetical protein